MQVTGKTILDQTTFPHPVKMQLTEKEIIAYADELTAVDQKHKEVVLRHDSEKGAFKNETKALMQKQEKLLNLLKTKEEYRDVDCYNDFNYFEGIVEIKRCDTDEVVTSRKITAEEYQQNLPIKDEE